MGKRYYCDFCDKSFADNPTNRRNHMRGIQHQNNRKLHYDSFKDPAVKLREELNKRPCKHFMQRGECNYIDTCKFSHLTPEDRQNIEMEIQKLYEWEKDKKKSSDTKSDRNPNIDQWLEKIKKKDEKTETKKPRIELPEYSLAPCLQTVVNVPPSLLPPPVDAFDALPLEEWG